nr:2-(3-amino-3-carboxypropyl)histidine synthase subunit 2-like isoform X1 [Cherax quadricarinatus]
MACLTNSGSEAIQRTLEKGTGRISTVDIEEMYEITRCVEWVQVRGYKKVGLQFPDELLGDAATVCGVMKLQLGFDVYILGDTSYGSCCVDEVAAEHIGADAIIHFGQTCLSPTRRMPVLYIFTKIPVNITGVVSGLESTIEDRIRNLIFVYDIRCHYLASGITEKLQRSFPHLITATFLLTSEYNCSVGHLLNGINSKTSFEIENISKNDQNQVSSTYGDSCQDSVITCECGSQLYHNSNAAEDCANRLSFNNRFVCLPSGSDIKDYHFIYLGPAGPTVNSLLLRFCENTFYCVNPDDGSVEVTSGVRMVMNRSAKLEMAKDAEIVGILIGTLGVADYQHIISKLKAIIKAAGKRCYTFVVGKPNEPKLANISEVDIFVYVACPETSVVERSTDPALYKKLIMPWELEVALLAGQEWSLAFETDFRQLLPGGTRYIEVTSKQRSEEVNVSLITNKTQTLGIRDDAALDNSTGAVMLHDGQTVAALHIGGGGEVLKGRTWQGLDSSLPSPGATNSIIEGRRGIASLYEDEKL